MEKNIGFIGCGNMGSAMLSGMISSKKFSAENIICSTRSAKSGKKIEEKFKINIGSNIDVARKSDVIILAVKPNLYEKVIKEIREFIKLDVIILAIAAGITLMDIERWFSIENLKAVRAMPNTPALVGEAMTAICANEHVTEIEIELIKSIFNSFGKVEEIEEKNFHGFIALCGSSPAYAYMIIEAMGEAAIKFGIPATKAYSLAAQSLLGASKMVLESGDHPAVLRDKVCSPGGTTIEAVNKLEEEGLKKALINAMKCCEEKSKEMSKK
ncbi:MAG: pyrroline-5-carboxylate reductase [Sarcina sp.]